MLRVLALALLFVAASGVKAQPAVNLYIPNSGDDTVSVVDAIAGSVLETIAVGDRPTGVAVSPTGRRIYVTNRDDATVSMIDGATFDVLDTVAVGAMPSGIAVAPDESRVYVSNSGAGTVTVLDAASLSVLATVTIGGSPAGIATNLLGSRVFVTDTANDLLYELAGDTGAVLGSFATGDGPVGLVPRDTSTEAQLVYTANSGDDTVSAIYLPTSSSNVFPFNTGRGPSGIAHSRSLDRLYVSNLNDDTVTVIDSDLDFFIATIPVGAGPRGIALSDDETRVFVANKDANSVSVIDTATNQVVDTIDVGAGPVAFGDFVGPGNVSSEVPAIRGELRVDAILPDNDGDGLASETEAVRLALDLINDGGQLTTPTRFRLEIPFPLTVDSFQTGDELIAQVVSASQGVLLVDFNAVPANDRFDNVVSVDLVLLDQLTESARLQGALDYNLRTVLTDDPSVDGPNQPTTFASGPLERLRRGGSTKAPSRDAYGSAVALSRSFSAQGAPGADGSDGAVWVQRVRADGGLDNYLEIPAPGEWNALAFGHALAIDGSRLFVGTAGRTVSASGPLGGVRIYDLEGPVSVGGVESSVEAGFGAALAVSGDTLAVGAPLATVGMTELAGRVFIYSIAELLGPGTPTPIVLEAPDPSLNARFGASLAAGDGVVVIGEPGPAGENFTGDAYLYDLGTGLLQTLARGGGGEFGAGIAVSEMRIAVGAPSALGGGTVSEFDLTGMPIGDAIRPVDGMGGDDFGRVLRYDGPKLWVSAPLAVTPTIAGEGPHGAVYRFDEARAQDARIGALPDSRSFAQQTGFGQGFDVYRDGFVIGAPGTNSRSGEATVRPLPVDPFFESGFEAD